MLTIFSSVLVLSSAFASGSMIERRAIQTQAVCPSNFNWMDTKQQNNSPCFVAAQLGAICNNGNYNLPALNTSRPSNYDAPGSVVGSTQITFCTCSWAFYNLISACTVCQDTSDLINMPASYSAFSIHCSGFQSNTYFPSNLTLSTGVTIPFYATTDPSTWTNGVFDVNAAKQLAGAGHADVGSAPAAPPKKSSNVGAIVGGVVGGLVAIAIAAAIAFYILRRARKPSPAMSIHESSSSMKQHMRSESDVSGRYTTLSSTPMHTHYPTSPTILTHSASMRSQPYNSSIAASTVPYGTASPPPQPIGSPPPGRQAASPPPPTTTENHVEPYLLPPTNVGDRKQAGPGGFPVFDPPSAPPNAVRMEISRPTTPDRRAGRFNPPAYSESTQGGSGGASGSNSRQMHRGKQGSTDTLQSLTSNRTRPTNVHHSPSSSGSGVANISGQLGVANPSYNTTSTPSGHGRQISGSSRDEKRPRAESDSFNPKDLA